MSANDSPGRSGQTGLEDVHKTHIEKRSRRELLVGELLTRWKLLGSIVVLLITTYALYTVDGAVSKDVMVFAAMAVLLAVYFVVTLRSDLKLE